MTYTIVFKGQAYLYGEGHVSIINGCQLTRLDDSGFQFLGFNVACASTLDTIFLCFTYGNDKTCHTSHNPTGDFGAIPDSNESHQETRIAASPS